MEMPSLGNTWREPASQIHFEKIAFPGDPQATHVSPGGTLAKVVLFAKVSARDFQGGGSGA
jgi:hypothetical protein